MDAVDENADILIAGEMGIGNTTAAAAITVLLMNRLELVGRGTGVDDGLARKADAVTRGLARTQMQHRGSRRCAV